MSEPKKKGLELVFVENPWSATTTFSAESLARRSLMTIMVLFDGKSMGLMSDTKVVTRDGNVYIQLEQLMHAAQMHSMTQEEWVRFSETMKQTES